MANQEQTLPLRTGRNDRPALAIGELNKMMKESIGGAVFWISGETPASAMSSLMIGDYHPPGSGIKYG